MINHIALCEPKAINIQRNCLFWRFPRSFCGMSKCKWNVHGTVIQIYIAESRPNMVICCYYYCIFANVHHMYECSIYRYSSHYTQIMLIDSIGSQSRYTKCLFKHWRQHLHVHARRTHAQTIEFVAALLMSLLSCLLPPALHFSRWQSLLLFNRLNDRLLFINNTLHYFRCSRSTRKQ